MQVLVAGRGGVGKTVIAAGLVEILGRTRPVWAIDADPDGTLAGWLGFTEQEECNQKAFSKYTLNGVDIQGLRERFAIQKGTVSFLRMGVIKRAGSGCYCRENAFLGAVLKDILGQTDEYVVVDLAPGVEQLSRGSLGCADVLVVVAAPSPGAVRSAMRLSNMGKELGLPCIGVVVNKVEDRELGCGLLGKLSGCEVWSMVGYDQAFGAGENGCERCLSLPQGFCDDLQQAVKHIIS